MISWMKVKIYGSRQRLSDMWRNRNGSSKRDGTPSGSISPNLAGPDDEDKLRMYITADNGTWMVGADGEITVEKLKIMALTHFFSSSESQKLAPKYRLISVSEKRMLPNGSTLTQEGLRSEDLDSTVFVTRCLFEKPRKEMLKSEKREGTGHFREVNDNGHMEVNVLCRQKSKVGKFLLLKCADEQLRGKASCLPSLLAHLPFPFLFHKIDFPIDDAFSGRMIGGFVLILTTNPDELLLVESFACPAKEIPTPDSLRGPTSAQINTATHNLKTLNKDRKNHQPECAADFHREVRKILMSLCEASARVLSPTPDAQKVINLINEQLATKKESELNPLSVKALVDMGFTKQQAIRALKKCCNHREAFEWLLEHPNDSGSDSDEETDSPGPNTSQAGTSANNLIQAVDQMLEKFRRTKQKEFKPSPKSILLLQEMGFQLEDIREALKITGNNQNAACEWLIGERRPSLEDVDTGLDPDSPIYEAIMSNASVQLSLSNPRMLLAFLSMLDNPNSANLWLNDPEAAPALNTIFKIYHSEKHVNRLA